MKFKKGISVILALLMIVMNLTTLAVVSATAANVPTQYLISNCDTSWNVGPTDPTIKVEGTGSISYTLDGTLVFQNTMAPINVALSESDAAVSFWMYVSDASSVNLAVVNLCSSGKPDVDEYQWVYEPSGWYYDASVPKLQTGWNHIVIPFAAAMKIGSPNKGALNFVRAYVVTSGTAKTFAVDDIRVVDFKKTIKSVSSPDISITTGTGFADAVDQVTVDATTYSGEIVKGLPVSWSRKGFQSAISVGCQISGTIPAGVAEKYGVINSGISAVANVSVNSSAVATSKYTISNCDTNDFVGTPLTLDSSNKVEGTGSVTGTQNGAGLIIFQKSFAAVNAGITDANGALDIWIYIENVDKTVTTQIELNSGLGGPDDPNEYHWDGVDLINLTKGWNRLILKLNQATKLGTVDINSLTFFRYYTIFGASNVSNTVKIDSVRLIDWTSLSSDTQGVVVSNCDSSAAGTGWDAAYWSQGFCKEGTGAFQVSDNSVFVASRHFPTSLNTGATEADGALSMWVYVNKTLINDGNSAIELTSSGKPDVDEYQWNLAALGIKVGWNYLTLYFNEATKNGNPNLSAINFFRVYDVGATKSTFIFDDIRVISGNSVKPLSMKGYKVSGAEVSNIAPNTTETDFRSLLTLRSGTTVDFANLSSGKVGTGTTIDVKVSGTLVNTYTAIVYGDVNGDGDIAVADLVAIKSHLLNAEKLTLDKFTAGDISKKGSITISDLLAVKKSLLGISNISQFP